MRIPRYSPQTKASGTPQPGGSFGQLVYGEDRSAQYLAEAAQGLANLSDDTERMLQEWQVQDDNDAFLQAQQDYIRGLADYDLTATKRQGDAARGLGADFEEFHTGLLETINKGLADNPNAAKEFSAWHQTKYLAARGGYNEFEHRQIRAAGAQKWEAGLKLFGEQRNQEDFSLALQKGVENGYILPEEADLAAFKFDQEILYDQGMEAATRAAWSNGNSDYTYSGPGKRVAPAEVQNAIIAAAEAENVDAAVLMAIARSESAFDPTAKNPNSSATGLFQFITSTGRNYGLVGDGFDLRTDPKASALAAARLMKSNVAYMRQNGVPVDATWIYLAHGFGAKGAVDLYKGTQGAELPAYLKKYMAHNLGDMTAQEYYRAVKKRMDAGLEAMGTGDPGFNPTAYNLPREKQEALANRYNSERNKREKLDSEARKIQGKQILEEVENKLSFMSLNPVADEPEGLAGQLATLQEWGITGAEGMVKRYTNIRAEQAFHAQYGQLPFQDQRKLLEEFKPLGGWEGAEQREEIISHLGKTIDAKEKAFKADPFTFVAPWAAEELDASPEFADESMRQEFLLSRNLQLQEKMGLAASEVAYMPVAAAKEARDRYAVADGVGKLSMLQEVQGAFGAHAPGAMRQLEIPATDMSGLDALAVGRAPLADVQAWVQAGSVKEAEISREDKKDVKKEALSVFRDTDFGQALARMRELQPQNMAIQKMYTEFEERAVKYGLLKGDGDAVRKFLQGSFVGLVEDEVCLYFPAGQVEMDGLEERLDLAKEGLDTFLAGWGEALPDWQAQERVEDLMDEDGVWVNAPDGNGVAILDTRSGKLVTDVDGKLFQLSWEELGTVELPKTLETFPMF